uniref:DUF4216 domain-containing protein n=1 Tax=Lactuca sativa TaxID=4236 RepID=A0A9R1VZ33_LACSA|nr:hypothetical protein LSAT_V11C400170530 [Lactuca sativa]
MTHEQHHKAHTYILLNCGEVTPYIQEFYEVAPRMYQGEQVASLRDKYFAQWFEQKVRLNSDGSVKHLEALARKPEQYVEYRNRYFVNGYKFHTQNYGKVHAMNNYGVCVTGEMYNAEESDYYGLVDEILEIKYYGIEPSNVVLFKCTWRNKVFYTPYLAMTRETKDLWVVVKTKPRGVFEVTEDEIDAGGFFQIDERFELPNEDQHEEQLEDEDDIEDNGNELVYFDDGSDYDED